MTVFGKVSVFLAMSVIYVSVTLANTMPGPPCKPGETRSGSVVEGSAVPNTNFIVHLTDSDAHPVGPPAGIPVPGMNVGTGSTATLPVNQPGMPNNVNQPGACDAWNETDLHKKGNGNGGAGVGGSGTGQPGSGVGGNGGTPVTPESSLQIEIYRFDPIQGVWVMYNIWTTVDLTIPNGDMLLLPDLYAADGNGDLINQELYGLVNLDVYLANVSCALDQCEEPFSLGGAFNVVNGQVAGLPGMFFSTTPWTFSTSGGFVNPGTYSGNAVTMTQHGLPSVPEPRVGVLFATGLLAMVLTMRKRVADRIGHTTRMWPRPTKG